MITRLHLQGKVARRAFVQECLKCVTSPTSDRKYLQIGPNPRLPRMFIFWHIFVPIKMKLPLVSVGTPLFYHLFYDRMWYLKQYRTYPGPKSGQNGACGRTDGRTDRRTSKFWGLLHKSPSGNNEMLTFSVKFSKNLFKKILTPTHRVSPRISWTGAVRICGIPLPSPSPRTSD